MALLTPDIFDFGTVQPSGKESEKEELFSCPFTSPQPPLHEWRGGVRESYCGLIPE